MNKAVKSRDELAKEYGISRKTLYRWMKEADLNLPSRLLTPNSLKKIYEVFGKPN